MIVSVSDLLVTRMRCFCKTIDCLGGEAEIVILRSDQHIGISTGELQAYYSDEARYSLID